MNEPQVGKDDDSGSTQVGPAASAAGEATAAPFPLLKTAHREASQAEGLYQLLVESVRDYAIFALDPAGVILSWNAGAERIKGYAAEEIIGRHFSIFYTTEDLAAGKPQAELLVAEREGRVEDEGWRVRKNGTLFWASVIITTLRDASGKLVGFAKVTRDLTARRRWEDALRESEERFRILVRSVKDYGIFMLDPEGRVASWNEGARRIKGYEAEEILGKHFSTFYPPEVAASGHPARELEIATREGRYEEEGWRIRKDGTRFWADVVITALFGEEGTLIGYAKVTRDLTERRLAQQREVEDARRLAEVEASNRAKTGFLAAMSHELRTPLNAIAGYAQLMMEGVGGDVSEQHRDYLARIRNSQQHLLGIVNDLLNYSRMEAGGIVYERELIFAHEVVDAVLAMVTPQIERKQLGLRRSGCPPDVAAIADRLKVEQVVLNLLSNAVKFTPEGGTITVFCGREGEAVTISVRDTGPGIPADKLEVIFDPFVQLGRTLTSRHEGAGLGLAISRDLARAMQGDVRVESVEGQGATFTLSLPSVSPSKP
ncbi:MAG: PAS domain-containing sensor histidine kinase [Gemmatimonadetes bacterium]|nr:PAS domain-containing sensor histidine kinase [Gemmatimonadota bacterium]